MSSNPNSTIRIRLIGGLVFLFAGILLVQLYFVQIVRGETYRNQAERQYVIPVRDLFERGSIYFTEKNGRKISAASLKNTYIVAINPLVLKDASTAYEKLSLVIDVDRESFLAKASKLDDPYEEIAKKIEKEKADAIAELGISGVGVYPERWRYYPAGSTASHVVGFVGYMGDTLAGRYGLEQYYEDILRRDAGDNHVNFFAEVFSNIGATVSAFGVGERTGDLVLTIEPTVQNVLEKEIDGLVADFSAESAGGIIINPKNGEIYALGASPDFDPNTFSSGNPEAFSNPLVENVYEMGSIIKPLTVASGLDTGVITAETTYNDAGSVHINGATLSNYDGEARGVVDMQEVLNQSLNTGVVHIMRQMGTKSFSDYFKSFEIGEETGIDLPNEARGITANLDSPREIEHATASFGQGIALTPIATVRALSTLGNGGVLITPHIVKEIEYKMGSSWKYTPNKTPRVFKESTSEEITRMLVNVVDDALVGGEVKLENYSVAAKTGTAQIAKENGKGYYDDRFLHTFFGYFPAYDPQFLVFLYVENPRGVRYASHTLTNPFMSITKFLLNYYEIAPDR